MDKDRFIEAYCSNGGNGTKAIIAAGFSGTYGAARVQAHRLLTDANIRQEIEKREMEIRRKMRLETELTREDLIEKFQAIHDEGIATGKLQAANKALENIGKMIGAYGEDNKQKGFSSLGAAIADLVRRKQAMGLIPGQLPVKPVQSTAKDGAIPAENAEGGGGVVQIGNDIG